ncbi:M48 family metallopeptidase [Lutibacter sp. TH_r2]|uniref:M48 family metallopeptidase n=1 Tax=Lutibacter sp. TH_r2 TaxID=3082083 RepID=UPI002952EBA5|nr:M48 family metallopeptidase [Lutibacter sp. TH_r2]MDV7187568.1 M48 family metallopeptidase [Lutibacter sp. TH_r2]
MNPTTIFYILIGIIVFNFIFDLIIDSLNAKNFDHKLPNELNDIYNEEEYLKSQRYKKENHKFSLITSSFSLLLTLVFFFIDGFAFVDGLAKNITSNNILITVIFFGIILFASDLLSLPLSYYKTFVIEEKYGFNKTNLKTFVLDKIKGWLMTIVVGGGILALITWFYNETTSSFWIYTWILITVFSVFMNMFYSKLIVPLFNKQTPLEDGELKFEIEKFAQKVGFKLDNIFVIDGSKRSTKANAYFSGFGSQKRITLYDTLINDLETDEIVAVLAHEVGHYKKKHIIYNLTSSIITMGITLYILSLLVGSDLLSQALGVEKASFHIGLIAFGILYSPISEITGFLMNILSRKFEYEADDYAKYNFSAQPLISALKKLSKNSLSNLTPHWLYVKIHYSHPSLLQRIKNLKK